MPEREFIQLYRNVPQNGVIVKEIIGYGIIDQENIGYYQPFIKYNKFGPLKRIPDDAMFATVNDKRVEAEFMGSRPFKSEVKRFSEISGSLPELVDIGKLKKEVIIIYNYSVPYVVRIYSTPAKLKTVCIFENCEYVVEHEPDFGDPSTYTKFVTKYVVQSYFIPTGYMLRLGVVSEKNPDVKKMRPTKPFKGNTILLNLGNGKYVFVAETVYEFKLTKKMGSITHFYSPIYNNEVPYPIAVTESIIIDLSKFRYVNRKFITDYKKKNFIEGSDIFYVLPTKNIKNLKGKHAFGVHSTVVFGLNAN